jgi:hypothetical protein
VQLPLDRLEQREDDVAVEVAQQIADRQERQRIECVAPARDCDR